MPHIFVFGSLTNDVNAALEAVVKSELDAIGLDLVEMRVGGSRSRPVLDVRIDRRDGGAVTVDDCAVASRALEAKLDQGDLVGERYVLEVSSPGVERPLRTPAEWRRFVGQRAKVLSDALGGREEVEILGMDGEEVLLVRTMRGEEKRIPLAAVREARLAFHW
ncbi:MAG TPA: ribosome maturation factor RimP [Gemmatimonadaceae bacterium]|jgi:ribosome maturation factor RimP|nr:ribosome maturation factor RimP [Gemmatimonadaceae bacterium]